LVDVLPSSQKEHVLSQQGDDTHTYTHTYTHAYTHILTGTCVDVRVRASTPHKHTTLLSHDLSRPSPPTRPSHLGSREVVSEYRLFDRSLYRSLLQKRPIKETSKSSHKTSHIFGCLHHIYAPISRLLKIYRSLLQKRPIKETIFCQRDLSF